MCLLWVCLMARRRMPAWAFTQWVSSVYSEAEFFLSIKNECALSCSLSLLYALAPALLRSHSYPLYILHIFLRPSLCITPTASHTNTPMRTHIAVPPSPSFSATFLSLCTYFIKRLFTGNSHPDLINCCQAQKTWANTHAQRRTIHLCINLIWEKLL